MVLRNHENTIFLEDFVISEMSQKEKVIYIWNNSKMAVWEIEKNLRALHSMHAHPAGFHCIMWSLGIAT